jgi:hypothetical protein
MCRADLQFFQQPGHLGGHPPDVPAMPIGGRTSETGRIRCQWAEAGLDQGGELQRPGGAIRAQAMQEQDRRFPGGVWVKHMQACHGENFLP